MDKKMKAVNIMPKMFTGNELISALTTLPEYDELIRNLPQAERLVALSDLYRIYLPSQMSTEIYSKLYLALLRSLQKKGTTLATQQQYQNFRSIKQQDSIGILGGSDSFTIIGTSGIGKSSAIQKSIDLISTDRIIETNEPYCKIIPCLTVQTPFDSSVKGLLLEILRKTDQYLGSRYHETALRVKATTDMLIGSVSQVALNHIGLLIVDEIQSVVNSKNGRSLVGMLTQLINNSGISICMVGTPESELFFEQAMQLARRSLGLQYNCLEYNQYFHDFCSRVFNYQYVQQKTAITPSIIEWLYEHSSGIVSVVISLIHDAQEIAILEGKEVLNLETLNEAYRKRLSLLHGYIEHSTQHHIAKPIRKKNYVLPSEAQEDTSTEYSIASLAAIAKNNNLDIVNVLKEYLPVVEVSI